MIEKTAQQKQIKQRLQNSLKGRRAKERRFVWFGRSAIAVALIFSGDPVYFYWHQGYSGLFPTLCHAGMYHLMPSVLTRLGDMSDQSFFDGEAKKLVYEAIYAELGASGRSKKKAARSLLSNGSDVQASELC